MMTNNGLVDGSWELTITVTDLSTDRTLRVKGDLHIGGVMLRLVEALGEITFAYFWNISRISAVRCPFLQLKYSLRICVLRSTTGKSGNYESYPFPFDELN